MQARTALPSARGPRPASSAGAAAPPRPPGRRPTAQRTVECGRLPPLADRDLPARRERAREGASSRGRGGSRCCCPARGGHADSPPHRRVPARHGLLWRSSRSVGLREMLSDPMSLDWSLMASLLVEAGPISGNMGTLKASATRPTEVPSPARGSGAASRSATSRLHTAGRSPRGQDAAASGHGSPRGLRTRGIPWPPPPWGRPRAGLGVEGCLGAGVALGASAHASAGLGRCM